MRLCLKMVQMGLKHSSQYNNRAKLWNPNDLELFFTTLALAKYWLLQFHIKSLQKNHK